MLMENISSYKLKAYFLIARRIIDTVIPIISSKKIKFNNFKYISSLVNHFKLFLLALSTRFNDFHNKFANSHYNICLFSYKIF